MNNIDKVLADHLVRRIISLIETNGYKGLVIPLTELIEKDYQIMAKKASEQPYELYAKSNAHLRVFNKQDNFIGRFKACRYIKDLEMFELTRENEDTWLIDRSEILKIVETNP